MKKKKKETGYLALIYDGEAGRLAALSRTRTVEKV